MEWYVFYLSYILITPPPQIWHMAFCWTLWTLKKQRLLGFSRAFPWSKSNIATLGGLAYQLMVLVGLDCAKFINTHSENIGVLTIQPTSSAWSRSLDSSRTTSLQLVIRHLWTFCTPKIRLFWCKVSKWVLFGCWQPKSLTCFFKSLVNYPFSAFMSPSTDFTL